MIVSSNQDDITMIKRQKLLFDEEFRQKLNDNSKINFASKNDDFYGLPSKVKQIFEESRKICSLYGKHNLRSFIFCMNEVYLYILHNVEWQDLCLKQPSVENGKNLIISLPTGGGKTLVAEILILKQLLLKARDALFILPFVSIVQEKVHSVNKVFLLRV